MNNLPKRYSEEKEEDTIYEEIEKFSLYELTESVAYEMAIRNDEVIKLLNEMDKLISIIRTVTLPIAVVELDKPYDRLYRDINTLNEFLLDSQKTFKERVEEIEQSETNKLLNNILSNKIKILIENFDETERIIEINNELLNKYWIRKYFDEDIIYDIFSDDSICIELPSNTTEIRIFPAFNKLNYIEKIHIEQGVINKNSSLFRIPKDINDYDKHYFDVEKFTMKQIVNDEHSKQEKEIDIESLGLFISHKRLLVPKENNKSIDINLNLALPKKELEEKMKKILDVHFNSDNSVIITNAELLDKKLKEINRIAKMPKTNLKKVYADMFFMYDYIKYQEPVFKAKIKQLKEDLDESIKKINDNWNLDKDERIEQIEIIKDKYKTAKKDYSEEAIKIEVERIIIKSKDVVTRANKVEPHYKIIKEYINKLKYKELLTGVKNS